MKNLVKLISLSILFSSVVSCVSISGSNSEGGLKNTVPSQQKWNEREVRMLES